MENSVDSLKFCHSFWDDNKRNRGLLLYSYNKFNMIMISSIIIILKRGIILKNFYAYQVLCIKVIFS